MREVVLSPRQHFLVQCLLEGLSQREIGRRAGINERAVKRYMHIIGHKLDIDTNKFCLRVRIAYLVLTKKVIIRNGNPGEKSHDPIVIDSLNAMRQRLRAALGSPVMDSTSPSDGRHYNGL